jgi:hypothetical protein
MGRMTTALLAVPLWILAALSIWNLVRNARAECRYRRDVDEANALMQAGHDLLRSHTTPVTRSRMDETLH